MRIDFVITELHVGGAERCLTELAVGLAHRGDDVRVFSICTLPGHDQAGGVAQSMLVDRLRSAGVQVVSGEASNPRQVVKACRNLSTFFKQTTPDVCQTFLFHANVLGTWIAKRRGVGVIVGGIRVAESRWLRCKVESAAIAKMNSIVCVSNAVRHFSINQLGSAAAKTLVIPNSVDVNRFACGDVFDVTSLGWPSDCQLVLFVGRLHPQKGIDLIQKQIDRIAPAISDHSQRNRKLVLVGDGPLASSIDAWCESVGRDRVRRLPWQADVVPLMRRSDLLLLPSRYEGMPNVVMEAMAAGRPIVVSKVEGISELLGNDSEQTFNIGDDETMASLIETLTGNPERMSQIGIANQERMRRDFSIASMVDAYRSHYRALLDRRLEVR